MDLIGTLLHFLMLFKHGVAFFLYIPCSLSILGWLSEFLQFCSSVIESRDWIEVGEGVQDWRVEVMDGGRGQSFMEKVDWEQIGLVARSNATVLHHSLNFPDRDNHDPVLVFRSG